MPVVQYFQPPGQASRGPSPRNSLLPIELVCLILTMLLEEFSFRNIMRVSHVCQHWRNAALGYKRIWATIINIDFESESWIKGFIRRSGDFPLTIESVSLEDLPSSQDRFGSPKWIPLWDEIHRVETLDLELLQSDESFISKILQFNAPLLRILRLSFPSPYDFRFNWGTPSWFHGSAPNLHCLTLANISFDPLELMDLRITHLEVNTMNALNIARWLELLNSQRQLKHLSFWSDHVLFEGSIELSDGIPNVTLPNLETFRQSYISEASADLFSHLDLPSSCDLYLLWRIKPVPYDSIDPLVTDSVVYQGLRRRFEDWASKAKRGQHFFWQIDFQNLRVSISISPCSEGAIQEGPCIELTFASEVIRMLEGQDPATGVVHYMDSVNEEVGSILLDMLINAASPIMKYPAIVSVNAAHNIDEELQSDFIDKLDLLLSLLKSSTMLILAGDNINDFISHIHRNTPAVLPNLSDILFKGDMSPGYILNHWQTLKQYLQRRSQDDAVGKPLPALSVYPTNSDDLPLAAVLPYNQHYLQDFHILRDVPVPSIESHQGCPTCPF